jgi:hypothetical protein
MSNPEGNISKYVPHITGAVFFMIAFHLVLFEREFHIPFLSYFNFSNFFIYFFHLLGGLSYFILITLFLSIWRKAIENNFQKKLLRMPFTILCIGIAIFTILLCHFLIVYCYTEKITFRDSFVMLFEIYICVSIAYFFLRNTLSSDPFFIILFCLGVFAFGFTKVTSKYEIATIRNLPFTETCIICFKNGAEFNSMQSRHEYCIAITPDEVFIYNDSLNKCTIYPMTEVFFISKTQLNKDTSSRASFH